MFKIDIHTHILPENLNEITDRFSDSRFLKIYSKNLIVLGFPSNQFLKQEPGSNKDIAKFCSSNYSITFPLFEKTTVKGKGKNIIYDWLTDTQKNGWNSTAPSWNFTKYLIDENGKLVKRFSPRTSPLSQEILSSIK